MTRAYHSASSIKLGLRCPRAWAYTYVDGMREDEVEWEDIDAGRVVVPPRVRATALGKAVHAVGERYFLGNAAAWTTLPGEIYASGAGYLPAPRDCTLVEVEHAVGDVVLPDAADGGPDRAIVIHGVRWAGFRDLLVQTRDDAAPWQIDYKTTSSIARWALTPAQLADDVQCAIYAVDLCERFGLDSARSRWLYLETKRTRRALPVDVTVTREHALAIVEPAAAVARELDAIERSADAEQRPDACRDYGGCRFHVTNGGPCDARVSLAARFAHERIRAMPIDETLRQKFGAIPAPAAAPPPPPPPAPDAPAAAPTEPAPPPAAPPAFGQTIAASPSPPASPPVAETPAPARRTRKAKADTAAAATAPAVAGGLAAALADATAAVAAAEAALADAQAAFDAAVAAVRELVAGDAA